jgi:hypothetical protein
MPLKSCHPKRPLGSLVLSPGTRTLMIKLKETRIYVIRTEYM